MKVDGREKEGEKMAAKRGLWEEEGEKGWRDEVNPGGHKG